jgi:hypothetical protein
MSYPYLHPSHFLLAPNRTYCDEGGDRIPPSEEESCDTCFYTGVATCTGLSLYFLKAAYLDLPEGPLTKELQSQKRFMIFMGSASAIAGAYRWYLG